MPRRHWLDPLARQLLIATGQLPRPPRPAAAPGARPGQAAADQTQATVDSDEDVERELLALRLRQNPGLRLRTAADVAHAVALGWRLDVNRATAADWLRLPGCRPDQVDQLLRLQAGGVQFSHPEDLGEALQLDPEQLRLWRPLLAFRWYGSPAPLPSGAARVPVNRAAAAGLAGLPGLTPERCRRLLQERGRMPFRDLADLQERLQLPGPVVESLIGRVSFQPPPAGPDLPPPLQRPGR